MKLGQEKKDLLDSINSLSWFLMDACWMIKHEELAILFSPFVLGSGLLLLCLDQRRPHLFINMAIVSWILMNITWMATELFPLYMPEWVPFIFLLLGLAFIMTALIISKNIQETFSHFRRFRLKSWR